MGLKKIRPLAKRKLIIATVKSWNIKKSREFMVKNRAYYRVWLVNNPGVLTYARIKKFDPEYIFFPHWPWKIPERIRRNYQCVVFHMTDLPFGRGGSPLQNLIARGIYKTKLTAFRAAKQLDAGDIYLKRDLILNGSAAAIFNRAAGIIFKNMIPCIIKNKPIAVAQTGRVVKFNRRRPEQGDIVDLNSLGQVYDFIRMLDAEGYPKAFIETKNLRFEFKNARDNGSFIAATVFIHSRT